MTQEVSHGDELRKAAEALQEHMKDLPQADCPVRHYFAPGMYLREMTIPCGIVVVGAVHKHEHLAILSQGTIRLSTEEGVVEFTAPATIHSFPGIKRICYAIPTKMAMGFELPIPAVITTMHHNPTNTQDLEVITREHVEAEVDTLLGGKKNEQALIQERAKELIT